MMRQQAYVDPIVALGRTKKWLRMIILATFISLMMIMVAGASANGKGATQLSGVGFFADTEVECTDIPLGPLGAGPQFALRLTGDLEGCMYVFIETAECSPSGTYRETGTETYFITGGEFGAGMFQTSYRASAKFETCPLVDPTAAEIFGRCQHPITPGSGVGAFTGVTGRLDFKDDVSGEMFRAPYRGHLKW